MKAYIQVKQLGKRKCSIEKMPVDFPVAPASVQELIEAVVSWQVSEYNERLLQSEMLKYLTRETLEPTITASRLQKPKPSSMLCNLMKTESSASF